MVNRNDNQERTMFGFSSPKKRMLGSKSEKGDSISIAIDYFECNKQKPNFILRLQCNPS